MATSGTYSFAPQVDDLLTEAWERLGMSGSIMTGNHARSAMRSLQAAFIDWNNRGINLWQIDRENATIAAGIGLFTTPPGTSDVLEMWVNFAGSDILLTPLSRDEWAGIPNKLYAGRPTQFWIERRIGVPVVHVWPVPDQDYAISINRLRLPQDVSALTQTSDAPVLWTEALYTELAARLAEKFAPDREDKLRAKADRAFSVASRENRERVNLKLIPRFG